MFARKTSRLSSGICRIGACAGTLKALEHRDLHDGSTPANLAPLPESAGISVLVFPWQERVFHNSPGLASAGICRIAHSNSRSQPPSYKLFRRTELAASSTVAGSCRNRYQLSASSLSRLSVQFRFLLSALPRNKLSCHFLHIVCICVDKTLKSAICSHVVNVFSRKLPVYPGPPDASMVEPRLDHHLEWSHVFEPVTADCSSRRPSRSERFRQIQHSSRYDLAPPVCA